MCVQAHVCVVFGIQKSNISLYKLMYMLFLVSKSQYMFVQAYVCPVFAIKKLNICVSKLMCVLFLCARQ